MQAATPFSVRLSAALPTGEFCLERRVDAPRGAARIQTRGCKEAAAKHPRKHAWRFRPGRGRGRVGVRGVWVCVGVGVGVCRDRSHVSPGGALGLDKKTIYGGFPFFIFFDVKIFTWETYI